MNPGMQAAVEDLKPQHFRKISEVVHRVAGIHLKDGKEALVRARLMKRLRRLGIGRVEDYLELIESERGAAEIPELVDVMTTNKTHFFREADHFHFLIEDVLPALSGRRLRFWSAACSSGEEPYSLAMILREHLPDIERRDVLILATDISRRVLERARRAVYPAAVLEEVPFAACRRHFQARPGSRPPEVVVAEEVRRLIRLAHLNLMEPWPMHGPFQVIFCRNVMIYFDRPTQQGLIRRFWEILAPGGYLFVGHSEGLSAIRHDFRYIRPAVYRK